MEPSIPGPTSPDVPCNGVNVRLPFSSTEPITTPRFPVGRTVGVCAGGVTPIIEFERSLQPTTATTAAATLAARIAEAIPRRRDIVFPRAPASALFHWMPLGRYRQPQRQGFGSVTKPRSNRPLLRPACHIRRV